MGVFGSTRLIPPKESGLLSSRCLDEHQSAPTTSTYYTKVVNGDPNDIVVTIGSNDPIPLEQAIRQGKVSVTGYTGPGGNPTGYNQVSFAIDFMRVNNLTDESIKVTANKFVVLGTSGHTAFGYDVSSLSGLSQRDLWAEQSKINAEQARIRAEQARIKEEQDRKIAEEKRQIEEMQRKTRCLEYMIEGKQRFLHLITDLVLVPGGTFKMGRTKGSGEDFEKPVHKVTIKPFYMGKHEVSQAFYALVMEDIPSLFEGTRNPVEQVSWYDAIVFCNKLSMLTGCTPVYSISGGTDPDKWGSVPKYGNSFWNAVICDWNANGYRLPTEAEWEYAARGAQNKPKYIYSGSKEIDAVAWYAGNNTPNGTKPVGTKEPNGLGIYDMSGNVWEWCWDWSGYYDKKAQTDPKGPATGKNRIRRGGSWYDDASSCRISLRTSTYSNSGNEYTGFRVCRNIP